MDIKSKKSLLRRLKASLIKFKATASVWANKVTVTTSRINILEHEIAGTTTLEQIKAIKVTHSEAIDALKSLLLDPEGEPSIKGSVEDNRLIKQALDVLSQSECD